MNAGNLVIVRCPMGYANRQLQNSIGRLLSEIDGVSVVHLLSGKKRGRKWQFNPRHIKLANKKANAPNEQRREDNA